MEENKICKCCYSKSGEGVRGGVHGTLDWREGNRQTLISPFVFRTTRLEWFPTQRHSNSWRDLITSLQTGGLERSGGIASQLPNKKMTSLVKSPSNAQRGSGILCCAHELTRAAERKPFESQLCPLVSDCLLLRGSKWLHDILCLSVRAD